LNHHPHNHFIKIFAICNNFSDFNLVLVTKPEPKTILFYYNAIKYSCSRIMFWKCWLDLGFWSFISSKIKKEWPIKWSPQQNFTSFIYYQSKHSIQKYSFLYISHILHHLHKVNCLVMQCPMLLLSGSAVSCS
jgi:hypothetical protein